ncbi:uncharacterized protein LOC123864415 [Maniola jurtina]|uniref:uncharacterized protein LOC123864415 n=1 Tax=Maniola jurtina TaxID=191418 RepID=UPI001E687E1E|nr:uncharacterized protein LOC123864415 [Maniola jurtina]
MSVGKHVLRVVIGDRGGELVVAGSIKVCDICLRGDALLLLEPGTVTVIDIDVNFRVGSIDSNLRVVWKSLGCLIPRDLSQRVNNFFNWNIPLYLDKYYYVINTIIGEGIRRLVNCFW